MSALHAIGNPRRIKASHRRRWKRSTGHSVYANNNPYTFTDPDGRESGAFYTQDRYKMAMPQLTPTQASVALAVQATVLLGPLAPEAAMAVMSRAPALNNAGVVVGDILVGDATGGATISAAAALGGKAAFEGLTFARSQLQHAFKHAGDFGVSGNANTATLAQFSSAVQAHVGAATTQAIKGTYRGAAVTHHVDPNSGLNVIQGASGEFLSGWKLSPQQLEHVLKDGKLGGGR